MAVTSLQERVTGLLTRQVAVSDATGVSRPDLESAAILESIATTLLVHPRTALYLANLARNKLISLVSDELSLVDQLIATTMALRNVSFAVKDLTNLEKAKTALIQIEGQDALDSKSDTYKRFELAVSTFLEKQLAKNVRSGGELVTPGTEARQSLPSSYEELKAAHVAMLDTFFALVTGVENFIESPFGTTLGLASTARARHEIEDIVETLTVDDSASTSRDIAFRLISAKAALKVLGEKPDVNQLVISEADGIRAVVSPTKTTSFSLQPLFTISALTSIGIAPALAGITRTTITTSATTMTGGYILYNDIGGLPLVVAKEVKTEPFMCPPNGSFCVETTDSLTGAVNLRVVNVNPGTAWTSFSYYDLQERIRAGLGTFNIEFGHLGPFLASWTIDGSQLAIVQGGDAVGQVSIHDLLGFDAGQVGDAGALDQATMLQLLKSYFPSYTFTGVDGTIVVETTDPTMAISLSNYPRWGMTGDVLVQGGSSVISLYTSAGPVTASDYLSPGDYVNVGGREVKVLYLSGSDVALASEIPYFDGPVTASSSLSAMWLKLDSLIGVAYDAWTKSRYAANLDELDRYIAVLYGNSTPSQQQAAVQQMVALARALQDLLTALEDPETLLPPGAAARERDIVNGVIATLEEKKYDKALDLLLKCQIQEIFYLDWQTVSFGGALMKAMSSIARNDFVYPNAMKDEVNTPAIQKGAT